MTSLEEHLKRIAPSGGVARAKKLGKKKLRKHALLMVAARKAKSPQTK